MCNENEECIGFEFWPGNRTITSKCILKKYITLSRGQVIGVSIFAKMEWIHDECKFADRRITSALDKGDTPIGVVCISYHGTEDPDAAHGVVEPAIGHEDVGHGHLLLQEHHSSQTSRSQSPSRAALMRSDRSMDRQLTHGDA
mmetsp:Transcript_130609/g.237568  ORF Transcript_130609/g.237568 Transcript_130609/m.237568 type:complete len:143 (-) Transcript_130609:47-475(-)